MGSEDRKGDKKTEERKKPSSTSKSVPSGSSSKHAPQLTLTDRTKPPADNKGPTSLSKNPPQSSSAKVSNTQQPSVKVSNTPQPSASDKGKGIAQPPASGSNSAGSASNTSFRDLRADAKRMVDLGRRSSSNPAKLSREKLQIFVEHSGILMIQGSPDRKNFIMITQDDDRFLLAALCIELALKLLESKIGRRALIENGQEIIRRRESMKKSSDPGVKANGSHAYPTPQKLDTMGTWVDSWLAKLRNDFPKLYLSYTLLPHTSGSTSKSTRVQNMQDYNPKAAADLLLQATVSIPITYLVKYEILYIYIKLEGLVPLTSHFFFFFFLRISINSLFFYMLLSYLRPERTRRPRGRQLLPTETTTVV